jgi:hypothetical protein
VPAVLAGSLLSTRVTDRWLRPVIFTVILASGLGYAGVGGVYLVPAVTVALIAGLAGARLTGGRGRTGTAPPGPSDPVSAPAGADSLTVGYAPLSR